MLAVVGAVFFAQLFVAGLNLLWSALGVGGVGAGGWRLHFFPHVRSRVDRFLDPASGDNYQVDEALEAFGNGGLLGRGPGEGRVKDVLPDAHADFVFAVAGEEFGLLVCLSSCACSPSSCCAACCGCWREQDLFVVLAATGL